MSVVAHKYNLKSFFPIIIASARLTHRLTKPGLGPTEVWGPLKCRVQNPYEEFFKLQISTQKVDKKQFFTISNFQ
jgi:hypothetical protein